MTINQDSPSSALSASDRQGRDKSPGAEETLSLLLRGSMQELQFALGVVPDGQLLYLMINLPYKCNYRCLKCCNLLDLVEPASPRPEPRVVRKTLEEAMDAAVEHGIRVVVIAGEGEPLLDRDFRWVVEAASSRGLVPYVFTNGSLLTEETVGFLSENGTSLIVGLDSLDAETYRKLTGGGGDIDLVRRNIDLCRRRYGQMIEHLRGFRVGSLAINMVVTNLNILEIPKLREFCGDDIVFVCNQPTCIGRAETNWSILYGKTPTGANVNAVIKRMSTIQQPLGTTSDGMWCAYMRNGVSISPSGQVLTCAYSLETQGLYDTLKIDDLKATNQNVMQSVEEFYRTHEHSRCILRHPNYKDFIMFLKNRKKK